MRLPSRRHPWTNLSRSPSPSHQRNIQWPPSHMGWGILGTWPNGGRQDFRWDWPPVSCSSTNLFSRHWDLTIGWVELLPHPCFQASTDSNKVDVSNSGLAMIPRPWWKSSSLRSWVLFQMKWWCALVPFSISAMSLTIPTSMKQHLMILMPL